MSNTTRVIGACIACLMTMALAASVFACDGKKKDKKDEEESAVQVDDSVKHLACDGKKKDKDKDEASATADFESLLACDGKKKDKKDEGSTA